MSTQIDQLIQALNASPENQTLLALVLATCLSEKAMVEASTLISRDDLSFRFDDHDHQLTLAKLCNALSLPEHVIDWTESETPELMFELAVAQKALGNEKEARQLYLDAIAANPTLEDPDNWGASTPREREVSSLGTKLTVISNDDTDDTEMRRLLEPDQKRVVFDDVGGLESVKQQIRKRIITPFEKPTLYLKFKKRVGGGILLYGPPGCGKTLLARATAGECRADFFNVAISDVLDMYLGESERKLHALFENARQHKPAVLFFDEIEALAGKRQYTREATASKLVSQFLAEMDSMSSKNEGMLLMGATNVPWAIDPAFRRPGRFERVMFIPPPDREARAAILAIHISGRPHESGIDMSSLASKTSGYSGADLEQLVENASDLAIEASIEQRKEVEISQAHLFQSLRDVKPTTLEWLATARNYARYANEAGQYDDVLEFLKKHGK